MGIKISDLTSATSLTGSEELPIVQAGNTKKATISQVKAQNYSTTEQVIGTWIDGKPLYEVVIQDTMPNVTTAGTEVSKVVTWGTNVEYAFCVCAWYATSNGNKNPLPYFTTQGYRAVVIIGSQGNNNKIVLTSSSTGQNGLLTTIIVRYTKTTDTATQTRSANLTMNTGSLVGSGEKSNLLLEDFSGDTAEEEKDEEELPIEEIPLEEKTEVKESGENDELR